MKLAPQTSGLQSSLSQLQCLPRCLLQTQLQPLSTMHHLRLGEPDTAKMAAQLGGLGDKRPSLGEPKALQPCTLLRMLVMAQGCRLRFA